MTSTFEQCYRAAESRDARFDGVFYLAVTTTRIYCRPSCPARMPKRCNSRFFATAAAAQTAGFRACLRCRPDAVPGSAEWDARGDVAARAMRLIDDGAVDRVGVEGLAADLGYTSRHLARLLVAELGAGPLALARTRRAHTARLLLETTPLPVTDVGFAAGFGSVRQFNDTIREVFGRTPTEVRRGRRAATSVRGTITLRLPFRAPLDVTALWSYLSDRAVPGLEHAAWPTYARTLRLHHGVGVVALDLGDATAVVAGKGHVTARLHLDDHRDLSSAVARCRRLLHLDADPAGTVAALGDDPLLGPLVRRRPGLRVPGSVDAYETAVRTIVGQQVSVAAARTVVGDLVRRYGTPMSTPYGTLTHVFPEPKALAAATELPMPATRAAAVAALARAVDAGDLRLGPGADRDAAAVALRTLPGVGPWTAAYVALRGLGDPDAFPDGDLGLRQALRALGVDGPRAVTTLAQRWRPLRAHAAQQLWTHLRHGDAPTPTRVAGTADPDGPPHAVTDSTERISLP